MKMKNKLLSLLVSLSLILTLAVPAFAETDYGYIYDETEQLGSELVTTLGVETLPNLEDAYGVGAHVDVLTSLGDYENIDDAANYLFDEYSYGIGDNQDGISLTLLVKEDNGSYIIEDWTVTTSGIMNEAIDPIHAKVSAILTDEMWKGDIEQDAQALAAAAGAINEGVVDFMEGNLTEAPAETEKEPDDKPADTVNADFIFDEADILTDEEEAQLEAKIAESAEEYGCGIYFASVNDFNDYAGTIEDAAGIIYDKYDMGVGSDDSGIILLMSMSNRKYDLKSKGYALTVFDIEGRNHLNDFFLDNFKEDDWFGGVSDYVDYGFEMLSVAKGDYPLDENETKVEDEDENENKVEVEDEYEDSSAGSTRAVGIIASVALAFLTASLVTGMLKGQLKSVARGVEASNYQSGGVNMRNTRDTYTHTTTTRVYVEPPKNDRSSDNDYSDTSNDSDDTSGDF